MILDAFNLEGKVAVVTGCSAGLGKGLAEGLAEAGADIAGVYNSTPPDQIEKSVCEKGRNFCGIQADLRQTGKVKEIVSKAVDELGRIDILVNNAGLIRREDALHFGEKDWDDVLDVNLKSLFFLSQAAAQQFVRQESGGKIVNIASMLSFQGGIKVASYTASKSGVLGLTRILANEWAPEGINVNAIAPGYMATDMTAPLRDDEKRNREILGRIPAGRWGKPDDLKGAVVFLASDASNYIHGYTLAVDGGWLSR